MSSTTSEMTHEDWRLVETCLDLVPVMASWFYGNGHDSDEIDSAVQWGLIAAAIRWRPGPPGEAFRDYAKNRMYWSARWSLGHTIVLDSGNVARNRTDPVPNFIQLSTAWESYPRAKIDTQLGRLEAEDDEIDLCKRLDLNPEESLVVRLVHIHGLTPTEAARDLGWPVHRVQTRLYTARGRLMRTLPRVTSRNAI